MGESNAMTTFVTSITGVASDVLPHVWTIAGAFVVLVGAFIGIRWLLRAAKVVR